MSLGYVLISATPGSETTVFATLQTVPEAVELVPLFGEYDMLAKVEAPDMETLGKVILDKIRTVPGIVMTKTLAVAKL